MNELLVETFGDLAPIETKPVALLPNERFALQSFQRRGLESLHVLKNFFFVYMALFGHIARYRHK